MAWLIIVLLGLETLVHFGAFRARAHLHRAVAMHCLHHLPLERVVPVVVLREFIILLRTTLHPGSACHSTPPIIPACSRHLAAIIIPDLGHSLTGPTGFLLFLMAVSPLRTFFSALTKFCIPCVSSVLSSSIRIYFCTFLLLPAMYPGTDI